MLATETLRTAAWLLASMSLIAGCADSASGPKRLTGGSTSGTTSTPQAGPRDPQLFDTIAQGDGSAIVAPEEALVTDPIALERLWNRHTAGASPAPRFNFHAYAIVATFMGQHPRPGYATEIVRVDRDSVLGDVHVTVREFSPGPWGRHILSPVKPFHMISIPRPPAGARLVVHRQRLLDKLSIQAGGQSLIGSGDASYQGDLLVFRDAADFGSFWWAHTTDPMPVVDFSVEMAVAVLAGYRPSFGHTVETRRILFDADANELRVDFAVHGYRGGAAPPQVTETPFEILRVSLAPGAIRQEIRAPLPPVEIASDQAAIYAGARPAGQVARSVNDFDGAVQSMITGGPAGGPSAALVDFSREQALFAFLGAQPSTGHSIAVAKAEILEDGELDVEVHTCGPMGRPMAQATSPWQAVKMPKTFGPATFRFEDVTPRP